jgi:hypothetical protein
MSKGKKSKVKKTVVVVIHSDDLDDDCMSEVRGQLADAFGKGTKAVVFGVGLRDSVEIHEVA